MPFGNVLIGLFTETLNTSRAVDFHGYEAEINAHSIKFIPTTDLTNGHEASFPINNDESSIDNFFKFLYKNHHAGNGILLNYREDVLNTAILSSLTEANKKKFRDELEKFKNFTREIRQIQNEQEKNQYFLANLDPKYRDAFPTIQFPPVRPPILSTPNPEPRALNSEELATIKKAFGDINFAYQEQQNNTSRNYSFKQGEGENARTITVIPGIAVKGTPGEYSVDEYKAMIRAAQNTLNKPLILGNDNPVELAKMEAAARSLELTSPEGYILKTPTPQITGQPHPAPAPAPKNTSSSTQAPKQTDQNQPNSVVVATETLNQVNNQLNNAKTNYERDPTAQNAIEYYRKAEEKQRSAESLQKTATDEKQRIETAKGALNAQLHSIEINIKSNSETITRLTANIGQLSVEIKQITDSIAQKESELSAADKIISQKIIENASSSKKIDALTATIQKNAEIILQKNSQMSESQNALEKYEKQYKQATEEVRRTNVSLGTANGNCRNAEIRIAELKLQISNLDPKIHKTQIDELKKQQKQQKRIFDKNNTEIIELNKKLKVASSKVKTAFDNREQAKKSISEAESAIKKLQEENQGAAKTIGEENKKIEENRKIMKEQTIIRDRAIQQKTTLTTELEAKNKDKQSKETELKTKEEERKRLSEQKNDIQANLKQLEQQKQSAETSLNQATTALTLSRSDKDIALMRLYDLAIIILGSNDSTKKLELVKQILQGEHPLFKIGSAGQDKPLLIINPDLEQSKANFLNNKVTEAINLLCDPNNQRRDEAQAAKGESEQRIINVNPNDFNSLKTRPIPEPPPPENQHGPPPP